MFDAASVSQYLKPKLPHERKYPSVYSWDDGDTPSLLSPRLGSSLQWMTASGGDNDVWVIHQRVGDRDWAIWTSMDRLTQAPPQIAATPDGLMTISYVDTAGHPNYRTFDQFLNPTTDWTLDRVTNWVTRNAVGLVVVGLQLFAIFIGNDNAAYNKLWREP